jgi:hypothetical protein
MKTVLMQQLVGNITIEVTPSQPNTPSRGRQEHRDWGLDAAQACPLLTDQVQASPAAIYQCVLQSTSKGIRG